MDQQKKNQFLKNSKLFGEEINDIDINKHKNISYKFKLNFKLKMYFEILYYKFNMYKVLKV